MESIGSEKPKSNNSANVKVDSSRTIGPGYYRNIYLKKFSTYLVKQTYKPLKAKRKKGLILRLLDLVYDRSEVYAVIEIENKSGIDFEIDYLKIYKINGSKKRKSSYQKLDLNSVFKYSSPKIVKRGESKRLVYVLAKFTLGDSENLLIKLSELHGSRFLEFQKR